MFKEKEIDLDNILDDINKKQKEVLKTLKVKIGSLTDEKMKNRLITLSLLYITYLSSLNYFEEKDITNEDLNMIKLLLSSDENYKKEINFIPLISAFKNLNSDSNKDLSETKNEKEKVNDKIHICPACKNEFEENKDINPEIIECKKIIHGKCFIDYIERELNINNFPIKCPLCSGKDEHEINYKSIKKFLLSKNKDELETKLDNIALEYLSLNYSDEITYCLTPGCSYKCFYVYGVDYLNCPLCKKNYCLKCKTEWHNNLTCEEYKKKTKNKKSKKKFENIGQNIKKEKLKLNSETSNDQVLNKYNNNQGFRLFGNNQNNKNTFGGSLFKPNDNNNNQGGGLFGNNQKNKNTFGQSLFNQNDNQENNNIQGGGLFGFNQNNKNISEGSLFNLNVDQENNNNHQNINLFLAFENKDTNKNIFEDIYNNKSDKEDNNNQINFIKYEAENNHNNLYQSPFDNMKQIGFKANITNNKLFGTSETSNNFLFGAPINNSEKNSSSLFGTNNNPFSITNEKNNLGLFFMNTNSLFNNNQKKESLFDNSNINTQNNNSKPTLFGNNLSLFSTINDEVNNNNPRLLFG